MTVLNRRRTGGAWARASVGSGLSAAGSTLRPARTPRALERGTTDRGVFPTEARPGQLTSCPACRGRGFFNVVVDEDDSLIVDCSACSGSGVDLAAGSRVKFAGLRGAS